MKLMIGTFLIIVAAYALLLAASMAFSAGLSTIPAPPSPRPPNMGWIVSANISCPPRAGDRPAMVSRRAPGMPTVVYYHGNAYHMGNRAVIYAALAHKGFGVLGLSYRATRKSTSSPSEQGLYDDASAACISSPSSSMCRSKTSSSSANHWAPASPCRWPRNTISAGWCWKRLYIGSRPRRRDLFLRSGHADDSG